MPNRWFRIPRDGAEPQYVMDIDGIRGYAGNTVGQAGQKFIVRVYGTTQALDTLASRQQANEIPTSNVKNAFANESHVTTDNPNESFVVG